MLTNEIICHFPRLYEDDVGAAKVDVNECTTEPTCYNHPKYPNVKFWDLPGIGTPNYPDLETYLEKAQLDKYHTFLILAKDRFTINDIILAKEIKTQGKSFFFIRTKIDENLRAEKRKRSFVEAASLEKMRRNCMENLVDETGKPIIGEDGIFLISNHDPDKWDFSRLTEAILDALPRYQQEALTLSLDALTSFSKNILKRKVEALTKRIFLVAGLSAGFAVVPVPGLSFSIDTAIMFHEVREYTTQLGIPVEGSHIFKTVSFTTQKMILSTHARFSSSGKVLAVFAKEASVGLAVEEASRFIPLVGSAIASSISFSCTIHFLRKCLNEIEEVALAVLEEAKHRSIDSLDRA